MADLDTSSGVAVIVTDNRVGPARSIPATKDNKPSAGEIVAYPRDIVSDDTRCYLLFVPSIPTADANPEHALTL
jgi:hypothetical protein